jgi:hypothetical protein
MAATDVIDSYLESLPGRTRKLGDSQWGVTIEPAEDGGWPLDLGLRLKDGLLTVQAYALPAMEGIEPWQLLHWNRQTRMARFASTLDGDIWVVGDLPAAAIDERTLDRLLGLVTEGAFAVRGYAAALSR